MQDRFVKILRLMVAHDENRFCFDCHQRGPTYVNVTVGSFVCTTCGGALRKYNHRIKSISMSNFTPAEMDFLRRRGNKASRRIFLARGSQQVSNESDFNDAARDEYLRRKYELRCWYSDPTSDIENDAIRENQPLIDQVDQNSNKRTSASTASNAAVGLILPTNRPTISSVSSKAPPESSTPRPRQQSLNGINTPISADTGLSTQQPIFGQSESNIGAAVSRQTKNGSDPFCPSTSFASSTPTSDFFADFSKSHSTSSLSQSHPIGPAFWSNASGTQNSTMAPLQTMPTFPVTNDKYAALAELDDIFKSSGVNENSVGKPSAAPHAVSNLNAYGTSPFVASSAPFAYPSASLLPVRESQNPFIPVSKMSKPLGPSNPFFDHVSPSPARQLQSSDPRSPSLANPFAVFPNPPKPISCTNPFAQPASFNLTASAFDTSHPWPAQSTSSGFWAAADGSNPG